LKQLHLKPQAKLFNTFEVPRS